MENIPTLDSFLETLKLSSLSELFKSSKITTVDLLMSFDDSALKEIGVEKPGHRKRMINELNTIRKRVFISENSPTHETGCSVTYQHEFVGSRNDDKVPATTPMSVPKEEVNSNVLEQTMYQPEEELPPIPPKKSLKHVAPAPPPRNIPLPDPQTPLTTLVEPGLHLPQDPLSSGVPDVTLTPMSEPQPVSIKDVPEESMKTVEPNLSPLAPAIPPRTDLDEKPVDYLCQFNKIDEKSRSKSMPIKRTAPKPPGKAASLKTVSSQQPDTVSSRAGDIVNGMKDSSPALHSDSAIHSNNTSLEVRSTSCSIVKDKNFLGRIDSLMQSPRRPAPMPPKAVDNQESTGNDESSSSGSDVDVQDTPDDGRKQPGASHDDNVPAQVRRPTPKELRFSKLDLDTREGFLEKKGGKNNTKRSLRRWVVFDGKDLKYYKPDDKDSRSDCLQVVPLHRMTDVKIDTSGKRTQLFLETPNRTYIFSSEDHNDIGLWANVLMKAICSQDSNGTVPPDSTVGGAMADPDKEGWLKKQGHNLAKDWPLRYIVVKGGKLAYYRSYEDYAQDNSLNCLDMALSKVVPDGNRFRIMIKTAQQKDFVFEAKDETSYLSWVTALETSIQFALGDETVLRALQENPANRYCADCGKRNPVWASVNLLVIVCENCIGFHRRLGAQITKARSVLMDVKVWTSSLKEMMLSIGNKTANSFWEYKLPDDDKIRPDASSDERLDFIVSKYKERKYINFSQFYGQASDLGNALRRNVITKDVITTLQLLICGASVYFTNAGSEDQRTPFELASEANQELQMELLRQFNGHLTAEEREKTRKEEEERVRREDQEVVHTPRHSAWEKQGVLYKRGPKNSEAWKERVFYLQKRSLYYQTDKERELIDLTEVTDIQLGANDNDPSTINIVLPNRTFYLKGRNLTEAKSWYWAIKNKQVFGVDIRNQDLNSKSIPLIVAKCIDFVEFYALQEEGIYRRNGSVSSIKSLKLMFDQDAPAVRLTIENYPNVHDVCCLLKLFLREGLPEPLMTQNLYKDIVTNAGQTDHDSRLMTLYELIRRLPEVNFNTLKRLVLHLNKVIKKSDENKMTKENVNRLFAPIILNQGNSTNEHMLNKEYTAFDDILGYDEYLFDINPVEEAKKDQEMENARRAMTAMSQRSTLCEDEINEIQIGVSIENTQKSCMVKVNSKTTASEVCWYIIKFVSLSFDANWSLFEKIDAAGLERPLHTKDLVFRLVMESSKWEGSNWMLCLKHNYVAEMTAPYQDNRLSMGGRLHYRKNDGGWKEYYFKIKTGDLVISGKESGPETEKLPLHQWLLYIGTDERGKRKTPKKYGFTLMNKNERRYICTDDEKYLYRWISAILQIKHPSGIWTNLRDAERRMTLATENMVPIDQRKSIFLGRQSTCIRQQGSSSHIQRELQVKKSSLKRVR